MKPKNLNKTFKEYISIGVSRKVWGDSPEMDFAQDSLRDKNFRDFTDWEELKDYLLFHRAIPEAIDAAQKLFKNWKASQ